MAKYFEYGEKEIAYIVAKDKQMGEYINRIGHLYRPIDDNLFSSVVLAIIGQQISTKAQETLWNKSDDEVIKALVSLKGIGEWTAEMIMLFGMQRPNIFSFKDLAIHRGATHGISSL